MRRRVISGGACRSYAKALADSRRVYDEKARAHMRRERNGGGRQLEIAFGAARAHVRARSGCLSGDARRLAEFGGERARSV